MTIIFIIIFIFISRRLTVKFGSWLSVWFRLQRGGIVIQLLWDQQVMALWQGQIPVHCGLSVCFGVLALKNGETAKYYSNCHSWTVWNSRALYINCYLESCLKLTITHTNNSIIYVYLLKSKTRKYCFIIPLFNKYLV